MDAKEIRERARNVALTYRTMMGGDLTDLVESAIRSAVEADKAGSLTLEQLTVACRNIGYDLTCGACAELFYTGVRMHAHNDGCKTHDAVHAAVQGAVKAEREACARIADQTRELVASQWICDDIAADIRARGNTTSGEDA